MKTESTVKYILRLALTLLVITAVVAALLSLINSITKPIIDELNRQKTQKAIEAVLPGGGAEIAIPGGNDTVQALYQGESGYAVQVAPQGFNGAIVMMVGVDHEGKVLGISVISQAETAGLGAVCAAGNSAGEDFRNQFIGMSGTLAVTKDGGEVDSITSATITSRAVTDGVNAALDCVANLSKEG